MVGSINLDYRSLYLHFECAALLYGCAALADVGEFMMQLEKQSHLVELKDDEEVVRQVEEDRKKLEQLTGQKVRGLAYPGGGVATHDERVVDLIRSRTQIRYCRTTVSTYNFDLQTDLLQFKPTVYHREFDKMMELGEQFIKLQTEVPQIFYIWGHSYEFDYYDTWDRFEQFCKMMSGRDDIYYGTNAEILL
mgnify:CR=1 FL=1